MENLLSQGGPCEVERSADAPSEPDQHAAPRPATARAPPRAVLSHLADTPLVPQRIWRAAMAPSHGAPEPHGAPTPGSTSAGPSDWCRPPELSSLSLYGWGWRADRTVDENWMDYAYLVARNSSCKVAASSSVVL